jgi:hypothetical protein
VTTPDELTTVLRSAHGDPRTAVETFVTVHLAAAAAIDAYTAVQQEAKKLIAEVMEETGQTKYATRAGTAQVTAPSTTISYDGRALDMLCTADADLALKLFPYRKETQRAGTLRIAAAK